MRKRIYIAGPISKGGLADNVNRATDAFVRLAKAGYAPMCPQWSVFSSPCVPVPAGSVYVEGEAVQAIGTALGTPGMTHADWLGVDLPWVVASHAVLRLPGESTGADLEVACAERHNIPVFHDLARLIAWGCE